jgi:hypothetical protein
LHSLDSTHGVIADVEDGEVVVWIILLLILIQRLDLSELLVTLFTSFWFVIEDALLGRVHFDFGVKLCFFLLAYFSLDHILLGLKEKESND